MFEVFFQGESAGIIAGVRACPVGDIKGHVMETISQLVQFRAAEAHQSL